MPGLLRVLPEQCPKEECDVVQALLAFFVYGGKTPADLIHDAWVDDDLGATVQEREEPVVVPIEVEPLPAINTRDRRQHSDGKALLPVIEGHLPHSRVRVAEHLRKCEHDCTASLATDNVEVRLH